MTDVMKIAPNVSLAEKSATVLRKYIQTHYPDGGRIPGEHELSELLGVNRGTLRQALQILEQEGLVMRRQGSGTYANQARTRDPDATRIDRAVYGTRGQRRF